MVSALFLKSVAQSVIHSSICDELSEVHDVCSETVKVDAHTEPETEAAGTDDAGNPGSRCSFFGIYDVCTT